MGQACAHGHGHGVRRDGGGCCLDWEMGGIDMFEGQNSSRDSPGTQEFEICSLLCHAGAGLEPPEEEEPSNEAHGKFRRFRQEFGLGVCLNPTTSKSSSGEG